MNLSPAKGFTVSRPLLERHGELVETLCKLARSVNPKFRFTSIQVNKNYRSVLHCDGNNLGPSLSASLGSFTGGKLYVHGQGMLDVRRRFCEFSGNVPHLTCPFEGERYCLIFFVNQSYARLRAKDVKFLQSIGFNWPAPGLSKDGFGPKAPKLLAAAAALPRELEDCVCPLSRLCKGGNGAKSMFSQKLYSAQPAGNEPIVYAQKNPKKVGSSSHKRYDKYKAARTPLEAVSLGARQGDIAYDWSKGFIKRAARKGLTRARTCAGQRPLTSRIAMAMKAMKSAKAAAHPKAMKAMKK
jgi:hypothetical protein